MVLPFANLRSTAGDRKAHGLSGVPRPGGRRAAAARDDARPRAATGRRRGRSGLPPTRPAGGTTRRAPKPKPQPKVSRRSARPAAGRHAGRPIRRTSPPRGSPGLREELEELTTVRRPEVIARIRTAKELGDLKENADYTAAREEQSFLEGRIATIEGLLRSAVVIEAPGADGRVHVGSTVSVEEVGGDGDVVVYRIVGSAEADPAAGRISNASPVGRALLGRSVGETVSVGTPRGEVAFRVVAVE